MVEPTPHQRDPLGHDGISKQSEPIVWPILGQQLVPVPHAAVYVRSHRHTEIVDDEQVRRKRHAGKAGSPRICPHGFDRRGAVTAQCESDRGKPAPRPCRPVIRDGSAIQKSADVHPGGDVLRVIRPLQAVERKVRFGTTLAGADEDEAARLHFESFYVVGEDLSIRLDGAVLFERNAPRRKSKGAQYRLDARQVRTGFGVCEVEPSGYENEKPMRFRPFGCRCLGVGERCLEARAELVVARYRLDRLNERLRGCVD